MDFDLTGHRALVTGSSRGIGSTVAIELAKHGADIYVHCRKNVTKAEDVCKEIRQLGRRCDVMVADLSNQEETKKLACLAQDADILILNASVQIQKPWKEIPALGLYTANGLQRQKGMGNCCYAPRSGVCLETQYIPNGANLPGFTPTPIFQRGERYHHITRFCFYYDDINGKDAL